MKRTFFITGIGTEVGKTIVSAILTEALEADYWKPVQAGDLDHSDTHKVHNLISNHKSNFHPNAFALTSPMSPHAAAAIDGVTISSEAIKEPETANDLIIEGAGGLLVPINDTETILDLIKPEYEVILISRHYLGSINHTLMSLEILRNRGLHCSGIIFNGNENKASEEIIEKMGKVPVLGRIEEEPFFDKEVVSRYATIFRSKLYREKMSKANSTFPEKAENELSLSQRDRKHLWHPLTQHKLSPEMLAIVKAKGAVLYDEDGKEYIDGIASWYTSIYGHCNEKITSRVAEQMQQLDQVVFSGFTHRPAIELSEALMKILPKNQQKLFFSDNGSTATEVGIKMALQFHHNRGSDRKVMLAFEEGFHGDTFGAMSVSGLSVYNGAFEDHFIEVLRIPTPDGTNNPEVIEQLKKLISEHPIAGFIYEPLVQGAAGMKIYDAARLEQILEICKENEILLIADEVMTGFGKTGRYFASDYLTTQPDIICMSKALTAGLLPMAVTSCSQKVYDAFYSDELAKGLFHGHTYTANPLACTAALAGIELLTSEEMQENIARVSDSLKAFGERISSHPKVTNPRQLGVIFAFDLNLKMERYGGLRNQLFKHFLEQGVFLRPLGATIYILPPYTILEEELQKIYSSIELALEKF